MLRSLTVVGAAWLMAGAAFAQSPTWSPPPENQRCPSKWGANDERGSANHIKPDRVANAMRLVKSGEIIELGHVLNDKMPFFGRGASTCTRSAPS
jgi:hypothetical protein